MPPDTALNRLINEPKGKVEYTKGQAFLLHVFWECPSLSAANKLLDALEKCATATHRDTPCVPIYLFRISSNNADLLPDSPKRIEQHPALQAAFQKLKLGVPRHAVAATLARQNIDAKLLEEHPSSALPDHLCDRPVSVECTELYLDERSFNEHAGSRDYLAAYGAVMNPALRSRHKTIRLGTPTSHLIDRVLDPMLGEIPAPLLHGSTLWRRPGALGSPMILSLDLSMLSADGVTLDALVQAHRHERVAHVVLFEHPLRQSHLRFMAVFSDFRQEDLLAIRALPFEKGEINCDDAVVEEVKIAADTVKLRPRLKVNPCKHVGYILHARAHELLEIKA